MSDHPDSLVSLKASDSGLHIQLHPLILLTISDHITRHAARCQKGPIVGALLGQQNGREVTLEHAFECLVTEGPNGEAQLPDSWFIERVQQFKDVHKAPALDLVGWWSTCPSSGPNTSHLPIHRQILQQHNESAIFLAFHPADVTGASSSSGKLPLTIYESVYEGESTPNTNNTTNTMQVDSEEQPILSIKFRALPYSVETGEAEMIGIDTVARTARNAAVYPPTSSTDTSSLSQVPKTQGSSNDQQRKAEPQPNEPSDLLSPDEEELIASLNTRINAIRTLESRISLIKSYVSSISSTPTSTSTSTTTTTATPPTLSHPILRDINACLSHLSLLTPPQQSAFTAEALAQSTDVHLVALLGQLSHSISDMRELGKRTAILNYHRRTMAASSAAARKSGQSGVLGSGGGGGGGGGELHQLRMGGRFGDEILFPNRVGGGDGL